MKKFIFKLKVIKLRDFFEAIMYLFLIIPALIFKLINRIRKRYIWLVCDRPDTASDNGYHFFKYMRINHPELPVYYAINKNAKERKNVEEYGNIINYRSLKHWIYYLAADKNISSQKSGNPNPALFYILHVKLGLYRNRIFLQHGVIKDDLDWLYYRSCKFSKFMCTCKREYEFILEKFGYKKEALYLTGLARWDNLQEDITIKKKVLIMPTWRNWLGRDFNSLNKVDNIIDTPFFKAWSSIINNDRLIEFAENNNLEIEFYPHYNMQKYLNNFTSKSNRIKLLSYDTDIQETLRVCNVMITDYSSVAFDFGYMRKPVIYYQFDSEEFREKQYQEGYYNYEVDAWGPVVKTEDEVIDELIKIYKKGIDKKYIDRATKFFDIHDGNNCKRIYEAIINK